MPALGLRVHPDQRGRGDHQPLGFGDYLVYDECRGLQEGIWTCCANADTVKPSGDRRLFQFGWMMWQSNDPAVAAFEAWEAANPEWTTPEAYGFA